MGTDSVMCRFQHRGTIGHRAPVMSHTVSISSLGDDDFSFPPKEKIKLKEVKGRKKN